MIEYLELDFRTPGIHERAAASLLIAEVENRMHGRFVPNYVPTRHEIDDYGRKQLNGGVYTDYGIIADSGYLVAACSVIHETDSGDTFVSEVAVDPHDRGLGYGRLLMRYIAWRAELLGDAMLSLVALDQEFFSGLGFRAIGENTEMIAMTSDLLQTSPF